MTVRRFPGTPTADLEVAWDVVAVHEGWKIEVHKESLAAFARKAVFWRDWNPVRLIGPDSTLWASAATVEEMKDALPQLVEELASKKPLFTREDVQAALRALGNVLLTVAARRGSAPGLRRGR
jgi:hypothetical protein